MAKQVSKTRLGSFLRSNGLALASLLIALSGGIPGIAGVWQQIVSRATLVGHLDFLVKGNMGPTDNPRQFTYFLMGVTLSNSGQEPLATGRFAAELRWQGRWVRLDPMAINKSQDWGSRLQDIQIPDADQKDLQRLAQPVTQGVGVSGLLLFRTEHVALQDFERLAATQFRLTCRDALNRRHRLLLGYKPGEVTGSISYPKQGMDVRPKPLAPDTVRQGGGRP